MRLSIVLPIYNVSKWLGRCLASIRNLGFSADDYEIVAVNDGSTDDSLAVLEGFLAEEERSGIRKAPCVIVNQENKGLSAARNTGLKAAKGTYVWFVDSDDYLVPGCGKHLLERCEEERLDVLCFNLQLVGEQGDIIPYEIPDQSEGKRMKGEEFLLKVGMPPAAWCAIYRRGFLQSNNLQFLEGFLHEDQEFTPRAYYLARRIAYDPIVVYNYVQREGSIMKSANPKRSEDMLVVCQRLWDFAMENTQIESSIRYLFVNRVSFLFSQVLANYCRCGIKTFPGDPKQLPYYPLSINQYLSKKERYKYKLINSSVSLYLSLYGKFVNSEKLPKPGKELRIHS